MREVRIAALQWDVRRADVAANLAAARDGLARAREAAVELVLLPEMWATSFPDADDDLPALVRAARAASLELAEESARLSVDWAGSGFAIGALEGGDARPTNRLELFVRGQLHWSYDKLQLFGPTGEDAVFQAGGALPSTVPWRTTRISGVVCYDLRFPEVTRAPFHDAAEILLVPAQWPASRASHWRALVHGLAVSGQCFVLACNRLGRETNARLAQELEFPGNSLIVDPEGLTLAEGRGEAGLVIADIDPLVAREWRRRIPIARPVKVSGVAAPTRRVGAATPDEIT